MRETFGCGDFAFENKYCSALCIARSSNSLAEVQAQLLGKLSDGIEGVPFNSNVRAALLSTGIYLLHSDGKNVEPLTDYLVGALNSLPRVRWFDDSVANKHDAVTIYEQFAFCYNTVLSDLAAHFTRVRDDVVNAQIGMIEALTRRVQAGPARHQSPSLSGAQSPVHKAAAAELERSPLEQKVELMKTVTLLIGLLRSTARFSALNSTPLISRIYPPPMKMPPTEHEQDAGRAGEEASHRLNTDPSNWLWEDADVALGQPRPTTLCGGPTATVERSSSRVPVYSRHGSSFLNVRSRMARQSFSLCFDEIRRLFQCVQELLEDETLEMLDGVAGKVFFSGELKKFPYRTISETLSLVALTLINDVLLPHSHRVGSSSVPGGESLLSEVMALASEKFKRGQESLTYKSRVEDSRRLFTLPHNGNGHVEMAMPRLPGGKDAMVNRVRMSVIANSACLQLMVWCASDENDADALCAMIGERLWQPHRHVTAHMPENAMALEVLGLLANKFPNLSSSLIVRFLCKFLLDPCPLLMRVVGEGTGDRRKASETSEQVSKKRAGLNSLRTAAIESLIRSLRAAKDSGDKSCVRACLATLSSRLYTVGSDTSSESPIISENAIAALGKLGSAFIEDAAELVLQIFSQRFSNPPSHLDGLIIAGLATMWSSGAKSTHEVAMKMFTRVIMETSSRPSLAADDGGGRAKKFGHLSLAVDCALEKMAVAVEGEEEKIALLTRLLELFVQLGVDGRRSGNEKLTIRSTRKVVSLKMFADRESLSALIPKLGALLDRMEPIERPSLRLRYLFRDFWFFAVVMRFDVEPSKLSYGKEWICAIASKSPCLTAVDNFKSELIDSASIKLDGVSQAELLEIRSEVNKELGQLAELLPLTNRMDLAQCVYLLAVCRMEKMRVAHSRSRDATHAFFNYLEDRAIRHDKSGIWQCLLEASLHVFDVYLAGAEKRRQECGKEMESELEHHAQFLLVQFNNSLREVRRVADVCLTKLVEAFPFLLWNSRVITTILRLIQALLKNIDEDAECKCTTLQFPDLPWPVQLQDSVEGRRGIARDFTRRCEQILCEAVKWAPGLTNSCLLEYIRSTNSVNDKSLRLTISAVLNSTEREALGSLFSTSGGSTLTGLAGPGTTASIAESCTPGVLSSTDSTLGDEASATDISAYMATLSQRSDYLGQVKGMLSMLQETHSSAELAEQLLQEHLERMYDSASKENDHDKLRKAILLIAASFVHAEGVNQRLIGLLAWTPSKCFTPATMQLCVMCWNWILVAKEEVQLAFLREMSSCWTSVAQRGVGLFSRISDPIGCPISERSCTRPHPEIRPHSIWINFIAERVGLARYGTRDQLDMLEMMFTSSLSAVVGDATPLSRNAGGGSTAPHKGCGGYATQSYSNGVAAVPQMTRSVEAVGVRFRLLNAVLLMLQGETAGDIAHPSRSTVRERVYSAAFDFFSLPPQTPTQPEAQLRHDVRQLVDFWQTLYADSKYIRKEHASTDSAVAIVASRGSSGATQRQLSTPAQPPYDKSPGATLHTFPGSTAHHPPVGARSGSASTSTRAFSYMVPPAVGSASAKQSSGGSSEEEKTVERRIKNCLRLRQLLLLLISNEIGRIWVWLHPLGDRLDHREAELEQYTKKILDDARPDQKQMRETTRFAWEISPQLAIHLVSRFRMHTSIACTLRELVAARPEAVSHIPEALPLMLQLGDVAAVATTTPSNSYDQHGVITTHILTWAPCSPVVAISLLCPRLYQPHPVTMQYAVRVLRSYPRDVLLLYIPQIVQAVRWDTMGYVSELIVWLSGHSQLLAHQLLWNMRANMYMDENAKMEDPVLYKPLKEICDKVLDRLEGAAREFYTAEFELFERITKISGAIKHHPKGDQRRKACFKALNEVKLEQVAYLPSNPDAIILEIDYSSAAPMQSAAKAPFLARFKIRRCGVRELEATAMSAYVQEACMTDQRVASPLQPQPSTETEGSHGGGKKKHHHHFPHYHHRRSSSKQLSSSRDERHQRQVSRCLRVLASLTDAEGRDASARDGLGWKAAIFKVGDDVRQDMLALQLMQMMKSVCDTVRLDVVLFPYRVVATNPGWGVIECVPDSKSRDQLGRQTDIGLFEYFVTKYGEESSKGFQAARRNFVKSMAAYSVFSFLLQVKDRHNGNIMLNKEGHIIHIDFGFLFESSPGGNLGFEPDFKLSQEMVDVMGHRMESAPFRHFASLCVQMYLAVRPYHQEFISLVTMMLDTKLPCFRGKTIQLLRARFVPEATDQEAAKYMLGIINSCYTNPRSKMYDQIQFLQNDIPY